MRAAKLLTGLLALGMMLPAVGAIRKDGRYWIEEKESSIPAGTRLRITSVGPVLVAGDSGNTVRFKVTRKVRANTQQEAEQLFADAPLVAALRNETAVISQEDPNCARCNFSAYLEVSAPRRTQQTMIDSEGGSLTVRALEGRVNASTDGGAITIDEIGGSARANTAGGSISLRSIGGEVLCDTAGGTISLDGGGGDATLTTSGGSITARNVAGILRAETAGGSITADTIGQSLVAATSGGSINVSDVAGRVSAETAAGSVNITSAPGGVRAETAGGKIHLRDVAGAVMASNATGSIQVYFLRGQPLKDSILETNVGSIDVWLPADLKVTIEAIVELANGARRIQSDFDAIRVRQNGERFGPRSVTADGTLNGGGPVLRILNTAGHIKIRRLE